MTRRVLVCGGRDYANGAGAMSAFLCVFLGFVFGQSFWHPISTIDFVEDFAGYAIGWLAMDLFLKFINRNQRPENL